MKVTILDLRHAERRKYATFGDQQELTHYGIESSRRIRRILEARGYGRPGMIVTSTLKRTYNTALSVFKRPLVVELPALHDLKGQELGKRVMPATKDYALEHGLVQALFRGPHATDLCGWALDTLHDILQAAGECSKVGDATTLAVVSHAWMIELRAGLLMHHSRHGSFPPHESRIVPDMRCQELDYSEGYIYTVEIEPSRSGFELVNVYLVDGIFLPARFKQTRKK